MARTHATEERVTYAVTSGNNRRGVASGVLCGQLRSYMTRPAEFSSVSEWSAVEYSGGK
jgi:hypothetical protein